MMQEEETRFLKENGFLVEFAITSIVASRP